MSEDSATSSFSKGCFVFKPDGKKKRKREFDAAAYLTDSDDDAGDRFKIFQKLWETVEKKTEAIQDQLNKKILDNLVEFIKKHKLCSSSDEWGEAASEIPSAALMLGVNVPDHAMIFRSLCNLLQESVTPFVVSLQAKESAAVKHLIQKLLTELTGKGVSLDEEEEDDAAPPQKTQCTVAALCHWYKTKLKMEKKDLHGSLPVVLIFQDFEAFSAQVLQDFILICSRYTSEIPFIFIFGIATSPSILQQRLPHSVSSLLCIQVFHYLPCTQHLAAVFEKMILNSRFPFKLSSRVIQVLVGIFLYHDFSVQNFVRGIQFCMLEHFDSQPLSVLCCDKQEALLHAKTLSQKNVESIRHLPSFMKYVERQEPSEQVKLLTSDDHVKDVCEKLLKNLHKYHKNYYPVLQCLHSLTSSLPKCPLGKHIRELHVSCLEKKVWETEEYQSAMQLLRMLAKDELIAALATCVDILKSASSKTMKTVQQEAEDLVEQLEKLDRIEELVEEDGSLSRKDYQRKTDLFQLKMTLLDRESRRSKKMTPFENLREQVLQFIDRLVMEYLSPAELQPLCEVCYYSHSSLLRQRLNVSPRTAIQTALTHPIHYLQNESLKTTSGMVSATAPDLCIVYKLHLECGRLINLYDWLQAFVTVTSSTEDQDPDPDQNGQFDSLKHARFIQAVSEMEFLGFVKSATQKTDHVARLTWGGC